MIACGVTSSYADDEIQDNVPLDLVKAMLGSIPAGEVKIYSDLLSRFPALDMPGGLEIMGSLERNYGMSAFYRTELSSNELEQTLDTSITDVGYVKFEQIRAHSFSNGFILSSAVARPLNNRYCHDTLGNLSYVYNEEEGVVTLSNTYNSDYRSCAEQVEEQAQMNSRAGDVRGSRLQQYLPSMVLPETQRQPHSPFIGRSGYSGSDRDIQVRANLDIDWSIEEAFRHLAEQITEQSWVLDTESVGTSTATGIWTYSPEPGTELLGTLTVLQVSEETFELKFQLTSVGENSSNPNIFRSL